MTLPWWLLDFGHTSAVRSKLAARFAPATANRMLAALRGVLKAAFKLGFMSADHMTRACSVDPVRGARVPKGRALSQGELRALFEVCDPSTPGGARNAAVLGLLYGGGLRRAEVVALDLADFDHETGTLIVRGKGNKERKAFVTNGGRDALDAWLTLRGNEEGPLFQPVSQIGTIKRHRMSDGAVAELVRRLAKKSKIARFSPHDMRRTFIGDMLDAGADIATVQVLAGHASPITTSLYDRRGDRTKRKACELLHVPFVRRGAPPPSKDGDLEVSARRAKLRTRKPRPAREPRVVPRDPVSVVDIPTVDHDAALIDEVFPCITPCDPDWITRIFA